MKIETKYNVNDKVWVMIDNKPTQIRIDEIKIDVDRHFYKTPKITYVSYGEKGGNFDESKVFATKEELRDKIFK